MSLSNDRARLSEALARIADLERQLAAYKWQPIDTAPRDSSRVLVANKNSYGEWRVHEAWWAIPYDGAPQEYGWWCHDGDGCLLDDSIHPCGATHWMPLPSPPKV